MELARNIELKARLCNLPAARETARRLATATVGVQQQIDTYFHCPHGRLKLREIEGRTAQLVWYARPDQAAAKGSDYLLVDILDALRLKQALSAALGVRGVVTKRREIYLHRNVRIHLDEVSGLGAFLEFEAVLDKLLDDAAGHAQLAALQTEFGIQPADILPASYSDMLLPAASAGTNSSV